ncbi:ECF transporter S component [Oscillospiraceae bacterium OttesenSCG-928-F05]|nr:ECF transporter S component [Oscillospiraceae bacterium OttesenSCG-928-F05]
MVKVSKNRVQNLVKLGTLTAILLILAFSPLGYIPIGAMRITIVQIPVIIGAVLMGPLYGGILGAVFGLTSFYLAPTDPVFAAILAQSPVAMLAICLIPRILVGVIAGFLSKALLKIDRFGVATYALTGAVGAVSNTVLVLGSITLFFGKLAESMLVTGSGMTLISVMIGIGLANGVPEAVASALITTAVCKAMAVVDRRIGAQ